MKAQLDQRMPIIGFLSNLNSISADFLAIATSCIVERNFLGLLTDLIFDVKLKINGNKFPDKYRCRF